MKNKFKIYCTNVQFLGHIKRLVLTLLSYKHDANAVLNTTNKGGPEVRFYYSAETKYLAIVIKRVPNNRPNFGQNLSLLGKRKLQN